MALSSQLLFFALSEPANANLHRTHDGIPSEKRTIPPHHQGSLLCTHHDACRSSGHASAIERTKTRLAAGSKGTLPLPCTKTAKVGVSLALIVVITVLAGDPKHAPVPGLV